MTDAQPGQKEATLLLGRLAGGDELAGDELLALLYRELRSQAGRAMQRERAEHTLQPTALVHEAWLRLMPVAAAAGDAALAGAKDRTQFLRLAARAMRNVLIDHARARKSQKRGEGEKPAPLDEVLASFEERSYDVLALNEALEALRESDPDLERIVELRFFGGLSIPEAAEALEVSTPTIERRWRVARMWLRDRMSDGEGA